MQQVIAQDSIVLSDLLPPPPTHEPTTARATPPLSLDIRFMQDGEDALALSLNLLDTPELASALLDVLGLTLAHRGNLTVAHACVAAGLLLRQRNFGNDHPDTAASHNSMCHVLRQTGEFEAARIHVQQAMAINTRVFGAQSLPLALNLNELAVTEVQRGEFTAAEQAAASALQTLTRLRLQHNDYNVTRIMDTQGRIQQVRGNHQHAADLYEQLLAMDRDQVGESSFKYASHLVNYATVQAGAGALGEAQETLRIAIEIMERDAPHHPDCIDALANLGSLQRQAGRCDEALQTLRRVIERDTQARGPLHPYVGNDHARLGRLQHDMDDLTAAEASFRTALSIYEHAVGTGDLPPRHVFIAEARTWIARTLVEQSPPAATEAQRQAQQALQDWEIELGERSVEYAINNAVLGRAEYLQDVHSASARHRLLKAYPVVAAARGADAPISRLIKRWLDDTENTAIAPAGLTG